MRPEGIDFMASASQWLQGARPRTLGAAIAPVLVGTAAGTFGQHVHWWRFAGAMTVSLALQVGVNYANDYSDGVRGTDANRRGPMRLTASGVAQPAAVKRAATLAFGFAGAVGFWLSLAVDWKLLIMGAFCLAAGILYTGGPKPLGYIGQLKRQGSGRRRAMAPPQRAQKNRRVARHVGDDVFCLGHVGLALGLDERGVHQIAHGADQRRLVRQRRHDGGVAGQLHRYA